MLIAFANTKGGVGKSTLAVHFAVWMHDRRRSVAFIDADKQQSSSLWLAVAEPRIAICKVQTPEEAAAAAGEFSTKVDVVVADGPAGLDDVSRTILLLANLAVFPVTPSILDVRSLAQATVILNYARNINRGRPDAVIVLNRIKIRERVTAELRQATRSLGIPVANAAIRDLLAFRDAAQQGSVVTRQSPSGSARADAEILFMELLNSLTPSERTIFKQPQGEII